MRYCETVFWSIYILSVKNVNLHDFYYSVVMYYCTTLPLEIHTCDAGIVSLQFPHTLGALGHSSVCSYKYHHITHNTTLPYFTPVDQ